MGESHELSFFSISQSFMFGVFWGGLFLSHRGFRSNAWRSWEGVGVVTLHSLSPNEQWDVFYSTAQPDREEGDEGLLSRCLLHMRWRFVSRPSFPRNTPASCIHCCYPASPNPHPHHLSHSFSPDPHGISHHFCTYYLPLPDQTARFSSDGFNFPECRLSKTNILAYDS